MAKATGSKIVFISNRDGTLDIYVMNADGSGQTNLTNSTILAFFPPSWSPNGRQIAFFSLSPRDIFVINADGTELTNLTNNAGFDRLPNWGRGRF